MPVQRIHAWRLIVAHRFSHLNPPPLQMSRWMLSRSWEKWPRLASPPTTSTRSPFRWRGRRTWSLGATCVRTPRFRNPPTSCGRITFLPHVWLCHALPCSIVYVLMLPSLYFAAVALELRRISATVASIWEENAVNLFCSLDHCYICAAVATAILLKTVGVDNVTEVWLCAVMLGSHERRICLGSPLPPPLVLKIHFNLYFCGLM